METGGKIFQQSRLANPRVPAYKDQLVEHLDTFQSTRFESVEELMAFMARTIAAVRTTLH